MTKKKDTKRTAPISYRPPVHLQDEFAARVARSGLSQNAYITQALFGGTPPRAARHPVIEKQLLGHLISQVARLRGELHEITLASGTGSNAGPLLEKAVSELAAIRAACFKAIGRQP